jgi:alginate O-acetyltransferase complex protein AlgJ
MPTVHLIPALSWPRLRAEDVAARVRTAKNLSIVVFFLVAVGYPLFGFLFLRPKLGETENRALNPPPPPVTGEKWTWQVFPPLFEQYFGDRIGGRAKLLKLRSRICIDALGDYPVQSVWKGKDGWIFLNSVECLAGPLERYADKTPAVSGWAAELAARNRWCDDRGIRYLVVVCPDKHSIYPESLDDAHRRHPPPDPMPRFLAAAATAGVRVVDLRPPLLAAKAGHAEPIYFPLDTHWTAHGVLVGYRAIAEAVATVSPGFPVRPADRFVRTPAVPKVGDIAALAGLPGDRQVESAFAYVPVPTGHPVTAADPGPVADTAKRGASLLPHIDVIDQRGSPAGPSVLLLHDSFGTQLTHLFAPDCRRLVSIGTYGFPAELVETEKPRVVIQLFVERTLWNGELLELSRLGR